MGKKRFWQAQLLKLLCTICIGGPQIRNNHIWSWCNSFNKLQFNMKKCNFNISVIYFEYNEKIQWHNTDRHENAIAVILWARVRLEEIVKITTFTTCASVFPNFCPWNANMGIYYKISSQTMTKMWQMLQLLGGKSRQSMKQGYTHTPSVLIHRSFGDKKASACKKICISNLQKLLFGLNRQ